MYTSLCVWHLCIVLIFCYCIEEHVHRTDLSRSLSIFSFNDGYVTVYLQLFGVHYDIR